MFRKVRLTVLYTLSLALTGLGVASLGGAIGWAGTVGTGHWGRVRVLAGSVHLVYARQTEARYPPAGLTLLRGELGVLGFRSGQDRQWRWGAVSFPIWMLVATLLLPPGVAYVLGPVRRRRRKARGLCVQCGYALIGNTSARCPECGTGVLATARRSADVDLIAR